MSALTSRVGDIDVYMERTHRLIESAATIDPEVAVGLGCTESMTSIQKKIDRACAGAESLSRHVNKVRREIGR